MKKSLIALAALATVATAAQAQSNVTVYGVVDAGVSSVDKVTATGGRLTALTNGGLSTPRFGFKGTEDLGGGLKAQFGLESEFSTDTGATVGVLFSRASFVGLAQDGIGEIRFGLHNLEEYDFGAAYDAFSGNNIGGWISSGVRGSSRVNNGVQLRTASFNGLSARYTHSFGETAGSAAAGRTTSFGVEYKNGGLSVAGTTLQANGANGTKVTKNNAMFAAYNFGVASIHSGFLSHKTYHATTVAQTLDRDSYFIGARVPVGKWTMIAQMVKVDDATNNRKPDSYGVGATYSLSKRSTLYAIYAASSQDNGSSLNLVDTAKYTGFGTAANVDQKMYSVGIRHTF